MKKINALIILLIVSLFQACTDKRDSPPYVSSETHINLEIGTKNFLLDNHITIFDEEDGELYITSNMIDWRDFDINKVGEYFILLTFKDSADNSVTEKITITVKHPDFKLMNPLDLLYYYFSVLSESGNWTVESNSRVKSSNGHFFDKNLGTYTYVFDDNEKVIVNLKTSIIKYERKNESYQRDFLFKSYSGNISQSLYEDIEKNLFVPILNSLRSNVLGNSGFIFSSTNVSLSFASFNPNYNSLSNSPTVYYESWTTTLAKKLIVNLRLNYRLSYSGNIKYDIDITNNNSQTINFISGRVLFYNSLNKVIHEQSLFSYQLITGNSTLKDAEVTFYIPESVYNSYSYFVVVFDDIRLA